MSSFKLVFAHEAPSENFKCLASALGSCLFAKSTICVAVGNQHWNPNSYLPECIQLVYDLINQNLWSPQVAKLKVPYKLKKNIINPVSRPGWFMLPYKAQKWNLYFHDSLFLCSWITYMLNTFSGFLKHVFLFV